MNWLQRHWFLLALSAVVAFVFAAPYTVEPLLAYKQIRMIVVAAVLFLMALPLHLSTFVKVALQPQPALLAIAINLILAPLFCLPFLAWLGPELGGGLAIAMSTPCTLASAAVWTRRAGGNDVTALMVTVVTNVACVVVTPAWLMFLTERQSASINLLEQIQKLSLLVVLPIVCAQCIRVIPQVGAWASNRKLWLSTLAQIGLLYIVLLGSASSFLRWNSGQTIGVTHWIVLGTAIVGIHLALFIVGLWMSAWLRMEPREQSAVAIAGSQKTLMVGAEMAISLNLSMLPLLGYHLFQLFADTLLADWLKRKHESQAQSE